MPLNALALNCTLKPSPSPSSCELLLRQVLSELETHGVRGELLRAADYHIRPGVTSDEGEGDEWPGIRQKILDSDIFILGTPIWMGHPSSVCQRVQERLDAFLGETDEQGRLVSYDGVAGVVVVGNEDGAHHVTAELFQGLNDVGFTIPASCSAYWVGEAMQKTDYRELKETPERVQSAIKGLARNSVHVASLLKENGYPPTS